VTALLEARDLRTYFPVQRSVLRRGTDAVRAVDGVDLRVAEGETLGLVGESGSGKSTLGRTLVRLIDPTGGSIRFDGDDVTNLRGAQLQRMRRQMQIVFQDPVGSLNPRRKVGDIVGDGLAIHRVGTAAERRRQVGEILERVGLSGAAVDRYPHQFSGGQRQRIGIARALVLRPRLLVADEPVSALDVSIQAQVLNLLVELKRDFQLTYLFIAHNLAVVGYIADRVAVMYLGKIVEVGPAAELYVRPLHPYSAVLASSVPSLQPGRRMARIQLRGEMPSPIAPPSGCRFRTRCPIAQDICAVEVPPLREHASGRFAACHFAGEPLQ
jgi:oligopeptide/dipeptide ABC transporter ATP-binding protein